MININRVGGSITGSANGKNFGVKYTPEKYKTMSDIADRANAADSIDDLNNALQDFAPFMKDGYAELIETACPNLSVNDETGKFYLKTTDGVTISSKALPQPLVERILISVEKGIDFLPIVKFWTRWLRTNPTDLKSIRLANYVNQTTVDYDLKAELEKDGVAAAVALERATVYQTPITKEGLLCTYKVSREVLTKFDKDGKIVPRYGKEVDEDTGEVTSNIPLEVEDRLFEPAVVGNRYDEFYCYTLDQAFQKPKPGHFIRVGRVHELPSWDQVNCNDNQSGVKGLHCGNLDYIKGFQDSGTVTHNTFIDPFDIGAITNDGSGALRVRKYYTHSSTIGINRSIYHSSNFAALNDMEWDELRKAAIKASEVKAKEAEAQAAETAAL